ncbi:MAG: hypothetical protein PHP42_09730 [Bacteroidota bacterium]|nr:hypothetical protein [Bacteroidota bacterium]
MNIKPQPNHQQYLVALKKLGPEGRLRKAIELSEFSKQLFLEGLRSRFPEKNEVEIKVLYLERITKCYNRNF